MVVSRYFGGVKLVPVVGAGHGQAVRDVIEQSELIRVEPRDLLISNFPMTKQVGWNLYVENLTPEQVESVYGERIRVVWKWMRPR